MKIVYIAHPIGGDVKNNIAKVLAIVRDVNLTMPEVLPFAPYIVDLLALDDSIAAERKRGISNNEFLIKGFVQELWLYGDSSGCRAEAKLAKELNIPVVIKFIESGKLDTESLKPQLDKLNFYSKHVDITTYWDGGDYFIITVYCNNEKTVKDMVKMHGSIDEARNEFHRLQDKYVK